jgi:hypothetical protein
MSADFTVPKNTASARWVRLRRGVSIFVIKSASPHEVGECETAIREALGKLPKGKVIFI